MKLKSLIVPLLVAVAFLTGCAVKEKAYIDPVLEAPTSLTLPSDAGDQTIEIKATRAWKTTITYEGDVTDWLTVSPERNAASEDTQIVTFTVKENTGRDRVANVKITIGLEDATVVVTQIGPGGSADPVYFNDFDKAAAVKDGNNWPYLSQSDCWKNEIGTGISTISYVADASNKATVRNNSNSNGSGVNNIFFGSSAVFCVKNITLPAFNNYVISFRGLRNVYGATSGDGKSVFDHSAFKVYISADNQKWVSLDYAFDNGDPDNSWDLASSIFTLPGGTKTLSIYIPTPTETSTYRLDDLKLDVSENAGTDIDFSKGEDINVGGGDTPSNPGTPSGTGTEADPFNPTAAIAKAKEIGQTASTEYYYIKGFISAITEITDATGYGNATFTITDTKEANTDAFTCYRVKYFGGAKFPSTDAIKVGDEVVVKAQLVNFKGNTPETTNGEMVSINGKGDEGGDTPTPGTPSGTGTEADPFNPTAAIAKAKEIGQTASTEYYYIKGFISAITEITDATGYGNATFTITDTKEANTPAFTCYRVKYFGGAKFPSTDAIKVGDEVVVKAQLVNFKGNTPETNNGEMVSINGKGDEGGSGGGSTPTPGTASGTGTEADPFNPTAAIAKAKEVGTTASTDFYYIKGFVSKIDEITDATGYGNATFYMVDVKEGTMEALYCFRVKYIGGEKFPTVDALKVGDEVVIKAKLINYGGNTPETNSAEVVSINGSSEAPKSLVVSPLSLNVTATATSASFSVSANVAWTATSDNADFSLSQTSGDANASVTVSFAANTGSEARVANITVSTTADVPTKSYTVKVTQGAPVTGGGYVKVNSASDITAGSYIITFEHDALAGKVYAMKTAAAAKNPAGEEILVSSDVISTTDGAAYAWTVTGDATTGFTFKSGDNYLGSTNAAQGIVIGTEKQGKWVFSDDSKYGLLAKDSAVAGCTRCLAAYNNNGTVTFRFYNTGNDYKGKLVLYKLQN